MRNLQLQRTQEINKVLLLLLRKRIKSRYNLVCLGASLSR